MMTHTHHQGTATLFRCIPSVVTSVGKMWSRQKHFLQRNPASSLVQGQSTLSAHNLALKRTNDYIIIHANASRDWNYQILRNNIIQHCQPLSTPLWTNSTSQSYCPWKSPAFSTDGTTAIWTMFPRKACVDVNVYTHTCTFVLILIPCFSHTAWMEMH